MLTLTPLLFDGAELTAACDAGIGIYCWVNVINNKKYVGLAGGAKGLKGRLSAEIAAFKAETHKGTPLLFCAVQKYKLENFRVYLLCKVADVSMLGALEQAFIKMQNSIAPYGYNITAGGSGTLDYSSIEGAAKRRGKSNQVNSEKRAKTYYLTSPSGEKMHITNLHAFCKAYALSESAMRHLVGGRSSTYQGWKNTHSTKIEYAKRLAKKAYVVAPDGMLVEVTNIKAFAKEVGCSQAGMNKVALGKCKTHKGWTKASIDQINNFDSLPHKVWLHDKWEE